MAFLYQVRSDGTRIRHWELGADPLVVGRGDIAGASIEDDSLSWAHFLITREGDSYCLIDLKSSNGTWIDGERVLAGKLHSSQTISAGGSLFYFSDAPIDTPVVPGILTTMRTQLEPARPVKVA
jgi:pSer/pThr/pTyr-binding forkhead associated (FHA) protein